jgi:hypothetical protein
MTRRISALFLVLLAAGALLAGACNQATPPVGSPGPSAGAGQPSSVLLVASAESGTFEPSGDGYRLSLAGVAPQLTWFDDRPARHAGTIDVQSALDALYDDGTPDPPNAALSVAGATRAEDQVVVVELTSPAWDAAAGSLSFGSRLLDQPKQGLDYYASRAAQTVPASFGAAALFIDNIFSYNYCEGVVNNNSAQALNLTNASGAGDWEWSYGVEQNPPQQIVAGQSASFEMQSSWTGGECNMTVTYTAADSVNGFQMYVESPPTGDNIANGQALAAGCGADIDLNSTSGSTATGTATFHCP